MEFKIKPKLIVHEWENCNEVYLIYNGKRICFAESNISETKDIVVALIDIGFISREDVVFLYDEEIYDHLDID